MLKSTEEKKSVKYANIDMDKFKFDFHLFVPTENENGKVTDEKQTNA